MDLCQFLPEIISGLIVGSVVIVLVGSVIKVKEVLLN